MFSARIIIADIAVFLLLKIIWIVSPASINIVVDALALPSDSARFMTSPWTALSYMFIHIDFWHMVVNCLWLVWFGSLIEKVAGWKWLSATYLSGGIAGAVSYLLSDALTLMPNGTCLLGASAATLAVSASTLLCVPDKRIAVPFAGTFQLKWLAAVGLTLFALTSLEMSAAQMAAHAGGLAAGCLCAIAWRGITRRKMNHMKALARQRVSHMAIVDKARKSGYASLSRSERIQLFNTSRPATKASAE